MTEFMDTSKEIRHLEGISTWAILWQICKDITDILSWTIEMDPQLKPYFEDFWDYYKKVIAEPNLRFGYSIPPEKDWGHLSICSWYSDKNVWDLYLYLNWIVWFKFNTYCTLRYNIDYKDYIKIRDDYNELKSYMANLIKMWVETYCFRDYDLHYAYYSYLSWLYNSNSNQWFRVKFENALYEIFTDELNKEPLSIDIKRSFQEEENSFISKFGNADNFFRLTPLFFDTNIDNNIREIKKKVRKYIYSLCDFLDDSNKEDLITEIVDCCEKFTRKATLNELFIKNKSISEKDVKKFYKRWSYNSVNVLHVEEFPEHLKDIVCESIIWESISNSLNYKRLVYYFNLNSILDVILKIWYNLIDKDRFLNILRKKIDDWDYEIVDASWIVFPDPLGWDYIDLNQQLIRALCAVWMDFNLQNVGNVIKRVINNVEYLKTVLYYIATSYHGNKLDIINDILIFFQENVWSKIDLDIINETIQFVVKEIGYYSIFWEDKSNKAIIETDNPNAQLEHRVNIEFETWDNRQNISFWDKNFFTHFFTLNIYRLEWWVYFTSVLKSLEYMWEKKFRLDFVEISSGWIFNKQVEYDHSTGSFSCEQDICLTMTDEFINKLNFFIENNKLLLD